MTRTALFDAIRPFAPDHRFLDSHVQVIDALADAFGIPRGGDEDPAIRIALKLFEGCELNAYPNPGTGGDPWTIGWGATGPGIKRGVGWTQAQADARLSADVGKFAAGVTDALGDVRTTAAQRGAMISLAYNIGIGAFRDGTTTGKARVRD